MAGVERRRRKRPGSSSSFDVDPLISRQIYVLRFEAANGLYPPFQTEDTIPVVNLAL